MSEQHELNLAVIIGSTREGRFAPRVARWFETAVRTNGGFALDVIDLAEADLPAVLAPKPTRAVERYRDRLAAADAFVVVTPEYNHGYPAPLKQAIDLAYKEWQAKPVGFVSYGGMSGGLRAVEQLRQVFAELHATTIRDVVSLHNPWALFDDDARTHEPTGADAAAKTMLDQLAWWGAALRTARQARPYAA
ncbi:MAG TPA: NAD(P)H-dependent oxidoreductase [Acidimicrobiales bacterium]|nr:NAD(P)H-dependent oxidoreductase [Acidimicrobiales bacterium]